MKAIGSLIHQISRNYRKRGDTYLNNIENCSEFTTLKKHIEKITIKDLNIRYDKAHMFKRDEPIKYMKLVNEEDYGAGIYFFHPGTGFAIHDHPGMVVLTKILDGNLESHGYSVFNPQRQEKQQKWFDEGTHKLPEHVKEIERGIEAHDLGILHLKPGVVTHLTPVDRNMHSIKAIDECAMLDVFIPNKQQRHFYMLIPNNRKDNNKDENDKEKGQETKGEDKEKNKDEKKGKEEKGEDKSGQKTGKNKEAGKEGRELKEEKKDPIELRRETIVQLKEDPRKAEDNDWSDSKEQRERNLKKEEEKKADGEKKDHKKAKTEGVEHDHDNDFAAREDKHRVVVKLVEKGSTFDINLLKYEDYQESN